MKKVVKSVLSVCLMLMVVVLPLVFAGCSKNFTINITIEGEGTVIKKAQDGISVIGKTAVKKGENFEFRVEPGEGYEIDKIEIDGETYNESYNKDNMYYSFTDVSKNHTVKITFTKKSLTVTFMCLDDDMRYVEYTALSTSIVYGEAINLNEAKYGGQANNLWFVLQNGSKRYIYNNKIDDPDAQPDASYGTSNIVRVRAAITLYCDKTAAQLDALLNQ